MPRGNDKIKDFAAKGGNASQAYYAELSQHQKAERGRKAVMKRYYKPSNSREERINALLSLAYDVLLTALDPQDRQDDRALKAIGVMINLEKLKLSFEHIPGAMEVPNQSLVLVDKKPMELKEMDDETLKALAKRTMENGKS